MTLTASDPHHWPPIQQVVDHIAASIPDGATVLEIGPGTKPFERATAFVDFADVQAYTKRPVFKVDITSERLPFEDKSFDFVYCRHVLEDSWNPFAICAEMSRVGKRGYIETPSPFAELCRGVDDNAPPYRGYHHHRYIIWSNGTHLKFVSKYPLIEYLGCPDTKLGDMLREGPKYWNTYFPWEGSIRLRHVQSPADFNVGVNYVGVLGEAISEAHRVTDEYWHGMAGAAEYVQSFPMIGSAA